MTGLQIAEAKTAFYDAEQLAQLLNISKRLVDRLKDRGEIPGHTKLGRLNRWRRAAVDQWIAAGCPKRTQRAG